MWKYKKPQMSRLRVEMKKNDTCFYLKLPSKSENEQSCATPRLSEIGDPEVRAKLLSALAISANDGNGADIIFDISSKDGRIIGFELIL